MENSKMFKVNKDIIENEKIIIPKNTELRPLDIGPNGTYYGNPEVSNIKRYSESQLKNTEWFSPVEEAK